MGRQNTKRGLIKMYKGKSVLTPCCHYSDKGKKCKMKLDMEEKKKRNV